MNEVNGVHTGEQEAADPMAVKIARDREILSCIDALLPTIGLVLQQACAILEELDFEKGVRLLKETLEAVRMINLNLSLLDLKGCEHLLPHIKAVSDAVRYTVDAYERGEYMRMKEYVETQMLPAYEIWQKEIAVVLSGEEFRYLQN